MADVKEQGIDTPQQSRNPRKRRSKREIRQTAKGIQAVIAIVISIVIAILAGMSSSPVFTLNRRLFNYALVRKVWFGDLSATATAASQADIKRWFGMGSPEDKAAFDNTCISSFRDALVSIGPDAYPLPPLNASGNSTYAAELAHVPQIAAPFVEELDAAAANASDIRGGEEARADTALSLVLLLDQMSRNIFRADQKLIYTHYDRISRSLVRHLLAASPRADLHPKYRAAPVFRLWFYMPLLHSEFPEDHRKYMEIVEELVAELERGGDAEAVQYAKYSLDPGHKNVIDRFGRYPHRNEVLGRTTTKEEQEWLDAGGSYYGSNKK